MAFCLPFALLIPGAFALVQPPAGHFAAKAGVSVALAACLLPGPIASAWLLGRPGRA